MFVNLTPHSITLIRAGRPDEIIPPSGAIARVTTTEVECAPIDGVRSFRLVSGQVEGIPDPIDGTVYIASAMAAAAVRRPDVVFPGDLRRVDQGRVIVCAALVRHAL